MSTIAEGITSGTALVNTGDTTGALVLQVNGTTPSVTLAANGSVGVGSTPSYGTSGQVLTSSGTGSAPTWTTPSAGALILLSTVTASSASTVDIESTFNSTYSTYLLTASDITVSTQTGVNMLMKLGGTYITGSADYQQVINTISSNGGAYATSSSASADNLTIAGSLGSAADRSMNLELFIHNPSSTSRRKLMNLLCSWSGGLGALIKADGVMSNSRTTALTGLRFYPDAGTISGTFRLYGLANS